MFCPQCGHECSDTAAFCTECGAKLPGAASAADSDKTTVVSESSLDSGVGETLIDDAREAMAGSNEPVSTSTPEAAAARAGTKGKSHKKLIVGAVVAALVAAIAGGGFYAWQQHSAQAAREDAALDLSTIDNEQLKSYLSSTCDDDSDGLISADEAEAVTALGTLADDGSTTDKGLSSMGIEDASFVSAFPKLESLVIDGNALSSLDVSKCSKLKVLSCRGNGLSKLKLNKGLGQLYADHNGLESIDLAACNGLEVLNIDSGVSVGGNADSPSADQVKTYSTLANCYIMSSDPEMARTEAFGFAAGDAAVDGYLIYSALYPMNMALFYLDGNNEWATIEDAPAANMGIDPEGNNGYPTLSNDQIRQILASYYGTAPQDLSYLAQSEMLQQNGDGWQIALRINAPVGYTLGTRDHVSYGKFHRFTAIESCVYDDNTYVDETYTVVMVEDENSVFGYHLVSVDFVSRDTGQEETDDETSSSDVPTDDDNTPNGGTADSMTDSDARRAELMSTLTGYLFASNSGTVSEVLPYYVISSHANSDGTITFDAQFGYDRNYLSSFSDISKYLSRGTYTLQISENCEFFGTGGTDDNGNTLTYPYTKDEFMEVLDARNGLGLALHVVNGVIDQMILSS